MKNNVAQSAEYACSGCGACAAVCPRNAISLRLNDVGFFAAVVDADSCTGCGLCKKVCTRFDQQIAGEDIRKASLYALQSKDREVVKQCTSGGIAHELACQALETGWKVLGVIYNSDTDLAEHRIISDVSELAALDGSKYLQSNPERAFRDAMDDAVKNANARFLVFGTPCQISGLAKACELRHVREKFLLVEIFCHGVPSYRLWEKECRQIKKKLNCESFDSVHFRYKKDGWHSYCLRFSANGKVRYGSREGDLFYRAFFDDVFLNTSCMNCRMRKEWSSADIRLGDYWGKRYATRDDGVSAVFCSTPLGEKAVSGCDLEKLEPGTADEQLSCQNMQGYSCQELQRQTMRVLENSGIDAAVRFYQTKLPVKRKIKNLALSAVSLLPGGVRAKIRKMR